MVARYYPEIFDAADMQAAREIILTPEGPGADTQTRWALETPYVMHLIAEAFGASFQPRPDTVVVDYGCGVGRLAKALIDGYGCSVIGVDISVRMRSLANEYVGSDRFVAVSPGQLDRLSAAGLRAHAALAVWVLQHCLAPAEDIARIHRSLAADGRVFALNMPKRAVPAVTEQAGQGASFAWATDKVDVAALLRGAFHVEAAGKPDPARTPNMAEVGAYWLGLRRR